MSFWSSGTNGDTNLQSRGVRHDIVPIMPLGSARQVDALDALLAQADFVSLHVSESPETSGMIGPPSLAHMKRGT